MGLLPVLDRFCRGGRPGHGLLSWVRGCRPDGWLRAGELGYDYRILEARDWVGGLMWTLRSGSEHTEVGGRAPGMPVRRGAVLQRRRLADSEYADKGVLGYCKELGVPLELFVNSSDANYFYEENPELGPLSGKKVRLREVKADLWGSTTELLS